MLGVGVAVLGGWLGVLAAFVAVAVMTGYTVLVVRVVRRGTDTSCACFGPRRPITRVTAVRNMWLVALAVASLICTWTLPLGGGAVRALLTSTGWQATVAAGAAAITTALILWTGASGGAPHATADEAATVPTERSVGEGD